MARPDVQLRVRESTTNGVAGADLPSELASVSRSRHTRTLVSVLIEKARASTFKCWPHGYLRNGEMLARTVKRFRQGPTPSPTLFSDLHSVSSAFDCLHHAYSRTWLVSSTVSSRKKSQSAGLPARKPTTPRGQVIAFDVLATGDPEMAAGGVC
jgi:hypothetical protein